MESQWDGEERRALPITEAQAEAIAQRAAELALQHVYASIGKSVVQKFLYLLGAAAVAVYAYFQGKGVGGG